MLEHAPIPLVCSTCMAACWFTFLLFTNLGATTAHARYPQQRMLTEYQPACKSNAVEALLIAAQGHCCLHHPGTTPLAKYALAC
jgi:hypothetical protein